MIAEFENTESKTSDPKEKEQKESEEAQRSMEEDIDSLLSKLEFQFIQAVGPTKCYYYSHAG